MHSKPSIKSETPEVNTLVFNSTYAIDSEHLSNPNLADSFYSAFSPRHAFNFFEKESKSFPIDEFLPEPDNHPFKKAQEFGTKKLFLDGKRSAEKIAPPVLNGFPKLKEEKHELQIEIDHLFNFNDFGKFPHPSREEAGLKSPFAELLSMRCEEEEGEFIPNIDPMPEPALARIFSTDAPSSEFHVQAKDRNSKEPLRNLKEMNSALKQIQKEELMAEQKGCNCKKTMCLKLYCDCFSSGRGCGKFCSCVQCLNNNQNSALRSFFMDEMRENAVSPLKKHSLETENKTVEINVSEDLDKQEGECYEGCNCKKTGCTKKYCECFKKGLRCGSACNCTECENNEKGVKQAKGPIRTQQKIIKKQKKRSLSFNNFVEKFKLFNVLQGKKFDKFFQEEKQ